MSQGRPSITAVIPTFNNAATLAAALRSLAGQRYAGQVDVICVDGGSADATRDIAAASGARIVENPAREEEEGRALGLEAAEGELVLLLDADNELPTNDWLERLAGAMALAPDVVSADALFHERRPDDPPLTRLCALMGGTDPLAIDLGWADRWATHRGRWTGMEVEVEDRSAALLVRIDPDRPPPMGSNGFLVRRDALLRTAYRPFVHSDVVGDLAEAGYRFARVRIGIVHHYAPTLRAYARKARRRARRSVRGVPAQRRGLSPPRRLSLARGPVDDARGSGPYGSPRLPGGSGPRLGALSRALRDHHAGLRGGGGWSARRTRTARCPYSPRMTATDSTSDRTVDRPGDGAVVLRHPGVLTVVIPAYNEEERIARCVQETHATITALELDFELIVVDDGSFDGTLTAARLAADGYENVRIISYPENFGKGYALIEGANEAKGDLILFVDADLEVHPRQLAMLYGVLVGFEADVVIGSKLHRSSTIDYPLKRKILTYGYYLLVRLLFRLPVHDTQTGLKLYRTEVLRRVAGRVVVKHFAFDLEVLVNAHRLGYRIVEAPVIVTRERPYPRVGTGDARLVARDTLAIFYRTYIRRWYDEAGPAADAAAARGEVEPVYWSGERSE